MKRLFTAIVAALVIAPTAHAAQPASRFIDSVGVNIHPDHLAPSPYSNTTLTRATLDALGIRHVRASFIRTSTSWQPHYASQRTAALGVGVDLVVDGNSFFAGTGPGQGVQPMLDAIRRDIPLTESLEGPNENQPSFANSILRQVYPAAKADPWFAAKPVYGPSFINQGDYANYGALGGPSDRFNLHDYDGGVFPSSSFVASSIAYGQKGAPGKPGVATEFGFHGPRQCGNMDVRQAGTSQSVAVEAATDRIRAHLTGIGVVPGDKVELVGNLAGTGLDQPDRLIEGAGRGYSYYALWSPGSANSGGHVKLSREPFGPPVDILANAEVTKHKITGHLGTPQGAMQRWLIGQLLEHHAQGIERSYIYQLFRINAGCGDGEFGIANPDGTLTQTGRTLGNWLALLDFGGPVRDDIPLTVTDPAGPGALKSMQFSNWDGSVWVAFWPTKDGYGPRTITLQRPAASTHAMAYYLPSVDRTKRGLTYGSGPLQVPIGRDPFLVRIKPY